MESKHDVEPEKPASNFSNRTGRIFILQGNMPLELDQQVMPLPVLVSPVDRTYASRERRIQSRLSAHASPKQDINPLAARIVLHLFLLLPSTIGTIMSMVQAFSNVLFVFQAMAGGMAIHFWTPFTPFLEGHFSTFFITHAAFFNSVNDLFVSFNFHGLLDSRPDINSLGDIYTLLVSSPFYILDTLGCLAPAQTRAIPKVISSIGLYVSTAFNFLLGLLISSSPIPTDTVTSNYPSPSYYIASAVNSFEDLASNTTTLEDINFSATFSSVVSTTSKPSEIDPEVLRAILAQLGAYEQNNSTGLIVVAILAFLVLLGGLALCFKLLTRTPNVIVYQNRCPCSGNTAIPTIDSTGNVFDNRSELGTLRQRLAMPIHRHGRVNHSNSVPTSPRVFDTAPEYLDLAIHTSPFGDNCTERMPMPYMRTTDSVASIVRAEHVEQDTTPGSPFNTEPETPTSASLRRATEMVDALLSPISSIGSRLDLKQQESEAPISNAPSTPQRAHWPSSNIAPSTSKRGRLGTVIDQCTPPITRSLLRKTRNVFGPFLSRSFIPEELRDEFPGMSPSSPGSRERGMIWLKEQATPTRSARIKAQYGAVMTEEVRAQHPWAIVDSPLNSPSPLSRKERPTPLPSLSQRGAYASRDLTPSLLFETPSGNKLGCVSRSPTPSLRTPVSELRAIVAGKRSSSSLGGELYAR